MPSNCQTVRGRSEKLNIYTVPMGPHPSYRPSPTINLKALWRDLWALTEFPALPAHFFFFKCSYIKLIWRDFLLPPLVGSQPKWKCDIFKLPNNPIFNVMSPRSDVCAHVHALICKWLTELTFWICFLSSVECAFKTKDFSRQQMRDLTVVTWCHYMKRCKLNTSYSCGARRLMALMRWGRTVYTFPVTTYIWWTKLYISQHCLHHFLTAKQANPLIPAGTSYFMRWRAVCSHDHLWIFLSGC